MTKNRKYFNRMRLELLLCLVVISAAALNLFRSESEFYTLREVLFSIVIVWVVTVIIFVMLNFFSRLHEHTKVVLIVLYFLVFNYSSSIDLVFQPQFFSGYLLKYVVFIVFVALVFFYILTKVKSGVISGIKKFLLISFTAYCITVLFDIPKLKKPHVAKEDYFKELIIEESRPLYGVSQSPDIKFVILDGYPHENVISKVLKGNNKEFIDSLESLGFKVVSNSWSNYPATVYSVPSLLNGCYFVNEIDSDAKSNHKTYQELSENSLIFNSVNEAKVDLKVVNSSIFEFCRLCPEKAEVALEQNHIDHFLPRFMLSSALHPIFRKLLMPVNLTYIKEYKNRIVYGLNSISRPKASNQPEFTYSHIMCPHNPFHLVSDHNHQINKSGHFPFYGEGGLSFEQHVELLNQQIDTLNNIILNEANSSLNRQPFRHCIVLLSDHGFREDQSLDSAVPFQNFIAFYFPDQDYSMIPDTLSNVNVSRILLNKYFGYNLPMLNDSFYTFDKFGDGKFINITDKVLGRKED